ncbi:MAG: hypothetical protein N3A38_13030 [Planctomycetota bacterium]|nr:hypothetical protein [Planctomycetota bacterium]
MRPRGIVGIGHVHAIGLLAAVYLRNIPLDVYRSRRGGRGGTGCKEDRRYEGQRNCGDESAEWSSRGE